MHLFFFLLCLIFLPKSSMAAEPRQDDTLAPVVVTATRLKDVEEQPSRIPGNAIVVTSEDIQKLGAKTVQEVLQYQPGVVLYDQLGNEFQSTVDLRGFNAQPVTATSIFVDGVRVNEPDFNTINFDLIPLEDVDRIEILPGTATVFGRNALGGVINITTKRARRDKPRFTVEAGGGSFSRQKYNFTTDGPLPVPNFDYYFGVTRELTDGFRDASGGRITRMSAKLGYRLAEDTDATLSYTHVQDHLKQAGSLPLSILHRNREANFTPGDFSDTDLHLVTLNTRQKLPGGFSLALNGFVRDNDMLSFVQGLSSNSRLSTAVLSGGGTVQLTHAGSLLRKRNRLSLGAEYARNRFSILNSGAFSGFPFLTKQSTRENVAGVYLTDSFSIFESLVLSGGFRYDRDSFDFTDKLDPSLSGTKAFHRISPKAGLVYIPFRNLSLFFSYSEGIRTPTVTEMFAQGPFGSNPNLGSMKSRNYEAGAKGRLHDWLDAALNLFYTPVRDEILFVVTDPATFTGRNENISRTLRRGIEASLKGRFGKWAEAFVHYTVTKATFDTDVLLFSGQVRKGDDLPLVPRHRVGIGVHIHPVDKLTLSLIGSYAGSRFLLNDEPNKAKKVADYFVLNQRIAYEADHWLAHVTINNLTNRKYSTFGVLSTEPFFVPAPGINVFGGVTFRY
ncbi:MAG: TonB-dependent receptor [Deltaproteobacteria bacterium]|nr:TonB-dependent receptor [Deltaproteobacteria bacterium]